MNKTEVGKQNSQSNKSNLIDQKPSKHSLSRVFCPYCGCGCSLIYEGNDKVEKILPDSRDPMSQGKPCVKGVSFNESIYEDRLKYPMIRKDKESDLERCTWDEAYQHMKEKLDGIKQEYNGSVAKHVYFLGAGESTNESNYLFSKLCRVVLESNNIDCCARLCHAATAVGFNRIFGIKAIPKYTMDDLTEADCFLCVGTDPMEDYPVMFNRVMEARKKGARLISVDVASNSTSRQADLALKISPNGILPMLSHLIVQLVDNGEISRDAKMVSGFTEFVESVREVSQNNPISTFSFTREDMRNLYKVIDNSNNLVIMFGMGLTQHENGTENVLAITGLSVLLDSIIFPNRGKINVQGAGDVGADYTWKPVNYSVFKERMSELEQKPEGKDDNLSESGVKMSECPNLSESVRIDFLESIHQKFAEIESKDGVSLTEGLYSDDVEFVWVMGSNPSQSMPDLNSLDDSFNNKFVVYQHHHPGRTMEFADVVLPSTMVSEEYGSVTNGERRVRGIFEGCEICHAENCGDCSEVSNCNECPNVCEKNRRNTTGDDSRVLSDGLGRRDELIPENLYEVKSNSAIIADFAKFIGSKDFDYSCMCAIFEEMKFIVPGYTGLEFNDVASLQGDLADKMPKFKKLHAVSFDPEHFSGKKGYPFSFTTCRDRYQFCTGEISRRSSTLSKISGEPKVAMNPEDAEALGINDGATVLISSKVGTIEAVVRYDKDISKRVLSAPYHFEKLLVNRLTPLDLDPDSGTPCYKNIAVKVEKVD